MFSIAVVVYSMLSLHSQYMLNSLLNFITAALLEETEALVSDRLVMDFMNKSFLITQNCYAHKLLNDMKKI